MLRTAGVFANLNRNRRGQSLIVAVIVMFILLFVGGVFVGIVARNLLNSGRAKDTVRAGQFAEAGIKYADVFLQNSPLGADWRPAVIPLANINPNDPDANWLARGYTRVEMEGGRALIKVTYRPDIVNDSQAPLSGNKVLDPLGKYIKVESIGRVGAINPNDPTTFLNTPSPRLRREYVAYKQIGLDDYLRWVTNLNKDTKAEAFLGVPPIGVPVFMQMGGLPANTFYPLPSFLKWTGAPIRSNAKLRLGNNIVFALDRRNGDVIQVSDDIVVDPEVTGDPTRYAARVNVLEQTGDPAADPTAPGATVPGRITATDSLFNSFGGLIRDAAGIPDINGFVRSISRLDAPVLDAEDEATGFTRYRQLTRGSGKYLANPNGPTPIDLGRIGLGSGLYIDNFGDSDIDPGVNDAETLTRVWLSPGRGSNWHGPYYIPPGVVVEFGYPIAPDHNPDGSLAGTFSPHPGFRLQKSGQQNFFRDLLGQPVRSLSVLDFTFYIYVPAVGAPVLKLDCETYRQMLRQAPYGMSETDIDKLLADFNGVIFAEGNIKVHGLVPGTKNIPIRREAGSNPLTDQQVRDMVSTAMTLVSDANIYIDSSLVREDAKAMVALLAVENVVVNATMFTATSGNRLDWTDYEDPLMHMPVDKGDVFNLDFRFGENPAQYVDRNNQAVPINLLLRHGVGKNDTTYLNLFVNEWAPHTTNPASGPQPLYWFGVTDPGSPGLPAWTYPLHNTQDTANFEYRAFQLFPKTNADPNNPYLFTGDAGNLWPEGMRNIIRPSLDLSYASGAPAGPYLFGRAAVVPMDVRIEAVMYAQNGRFFIIPGHPINNNFGADTREQVVNNAKLIGGLPAGAMKRLDSVDPKYPLAGEPMDCRITILGAITENRTATAAEQSEWMKLWGWIPGAYGSTGHDARAINNPESEIPKSHLWVNDGAGTALDMRFDAEKTATAYGNQGITRGIRFIYDPALAMPYVGYIPTAGIQNAPKSFRYDLANFDPANPAFDQDRTLPPLPRLPVCPGFVFSGEVR